MTADWLVQIVMDRIATYHALLRELALGAQNLATYESPRLDCPLQQDQARAVLNG
jgi:hypothetical protein